MTAPDHVGWCRNIMGSLAEGGVWGVPRSALIFIRRGNALVLTGRMDHHAGLPISAEEWAAYQKDDYESIRTNFGAAGYEVRDETKKP